MRIALARCVVRSWRFEDASALAEAANNRNVWLTLRDIMPHPYTRADAESYLKSAVGREPELSFCIEVEEQLAGGIGLHEGSDVNRCTAELGYWIAEPFWGRGIMTAAVETVVRHSFECLPLHRIEAYVFANNPASARVLEKAGFEFEGRMRKNVIKDGQVLDSLVYARLRDDQLTAPTGPP